MINFFSRNKGLCYALITSLISGVSIFLNKFAVSEIKPPLYFTSIKNLAVGVLIAVAVLSAHKLVDIRKLTKKDVGYLVSIGILGGSIPFYLYFKGLSEISAINGAIIHKTLIIWVALLAVPLLKERITKLQVGAVFALFLSNFFVGGFSDFEFSRGEMFVLIATVFWGVENILSKKILSHVDVDIVVLFRMGLGSLILLIATFFTIPNVVGKTLSLNSQQIFWIVVTAALLFGYVKNWYRALKYAPATFVTSVLVSSTLVTNVLSAVFISHSWNISLTLQSICIILGTVVFVLSDREFRVEKKALETK